MRDTPLYDLGEHSLVQIFHRFFVQSDQMRKVFRYLKNAVLPENFKRLVFLEPLAVDLLNLQEVLEGTAVRDSWQHEVHYDGLL